METLIQELVALPHETEWVEFKRDNTDPDEIGQYISALSNSAALLGKSRGYLVWGVDDATHAVAGTRFRPRAAKVGNEDLENWLARLLSPRIDFRFHECEARGRPVVLLEVPAASHTPVRFRGEEYVRVGSYRKPLRDYPEKERTLWQLFSRTQFEEGVARERVAGDEVLALLDYPAYFGLTGQPLPTTPEAILRRLQAEEFLIPAGRGRFSVTNLGGVAFGKDLSELGLQRKAVRVITYRRTNRIETLRERTGLPGYAASFERLIDYIVDGLPANEHIGRALRYEAPMYPPVAVRELVANALIHQDFHLSGTGPMVEIFSDRIEITTRGSRSSSRRASWTCRRARATRSSPP